MRFLFFRFNLLILSILTVINLQAQKLSSTPVLMNWEGIKKSGLIEEVPFEFLSFEGAQYNSVNGKAMPVYFYQKEMPPGTTHLNVIVSNEIYEDISAGEKDLIDVSSLSNELQIKSKVAVERFKPYGVVSFYPFVYDVSSGTVKKLISFSLEINPVTQPQVKRGNRSFASNSVLASGSGDWYKIGVVKDGVYKMTYSFLENLGIDMENVVPGQLNVYGNGEGMLAELNNQYRPDDLIKNAIYMSDGGDGSFDSGDYILFYAKGPDKWTYNSGIYSHSKNKYCDTSYYFLNISSSLSPKRISTVASSSLPANQTVTAFDDYQFYEPDQVNFIKSGREWYGELYDNITEMTYAFLFPDIITSEPVRLKAEMAAKTPNTTAASTFAITETNTGQNLTVAVTGVGSGLYVPAANVNSGVLTYYPNNSVQNLHVEFTKYNSDARGWMSFLELSARRQLFYNNNGHLIFRDSKSAGPGNVADFIISSSLPGMLIWNVSDPDNITEIQSVFNVVSYTFRATADSLKEYVIIDPASSSNTAPFSFGRVDNQDLHGLGYADLIIITHPDFMTQAADLAQFHTDEGLSVHLVTTEAVYKEFSSGMKDATAIKYFLKMFYDRANGDPALVPENVLLFGDGSYDNKHRLGGNTSFIPTFESYNSTVVTASYVSDDYFVLLDDPEGMYDSDMLDMGIGRLPVKTASEAEAAVEKIKKYSMNTGSVTASNNTNCNDPNQNGSMGDWRNIYCFVADDEDGGDYQDACDNFADSLQFFNPFINIDKIYLDAFIQQSTPGGERYPDATEAIKQRVEKGALVLNYIGHGGEVGWAHERILDMTTVTNWSNTPRLPLFMTATCEFSRFDDPSRTSAGEMVLLNSSGGGIALFTTTRLVYAGPNEVLNKNFNRYVLQKSSGEAATLGEIFMRTKNATISELTSYNTRNFTLLGDPAVKLKVPEHTIITDSVNSVEVTGSIDTLKALSIITVKGHVQDYLGNNLTGFNGVIFPIVYDKEQNLTTLGNDATTPQMPFKLRKSVIYRGKASVTNGQFTFSFIVPKDIVYQYGYGKLSYYAHNGAEDATGYNTDIVVGGTNTNAPADNTGPLVDLYMNDENFVSGGITDENPGIFAKVSDDNGINTVGTGIGHDITAVLDENTASTINLNDYYESDLNTFKSGTISYPFSALSDGTHTLRLKVWDVYNNSGESSVEFVVAKSAEIALEHVLNYPNPFTTKTQFYFEHNQPCASLQVQIQVFTVSGKLVKTLNENVTCEGYRISPIGWDGKDDFGDRLAIGTYIYRVKLQTAEGNSVEKFEKLVILN